LPTNRIPDIFTKIRDGQAPERFTNQLLKDWGFTSKNDRAFISLLKSLGFLSADGKPTQRYSDYRDHSRSKHIMGEALRDAYGDIFLIKEHPTQSDKDSIEGKFKSFHNASDLVAGLMTKTFMGLLNLADHSKKSGTPPASKESEKKVEASNRSFMRGQTTAFQVCTTTYRSTFRRQKTWRFTTQSSNP
jgi:hypothetical protein